MKQPLTKEKRMELYKVPVEQMPIELYDMGRCTHKAVPGMYKFIIGHADTFVADTARAAELKTSAANRELPGYSIPQDQFTEMCGIWVAAHKSGAFPIDAGAIIYQDTGSRFLQVRYEGRAVGLLTSGSEEFAKILCSDLVMVGPDDDAPTLKPLSALIDEYLLGEEIGDKDHPETFGRLWEAKKGRIAAVFDDKVSVCEAAVSGFRQAGGSSRIYLVDRKWKGSYEDLQNGVDLSRGVHRKGELADRVNALRAQGVRLISNFEQAEYENY